MAEIEAAGDDDPDTTARPLASDAGDHRVLLYVIDGLAPDGGGVGDPQRLKHVTEAARAAVAGAFTSSRVRVALDAEVTEGQSSTGRVRI